MPPEYFEKTSLLPFVAIIEGKQSLYKALNELDRTNMERALGFGLAVAVTTRVFAHIIARGAAAANSMKK